jgi:hypothetical protein
VFRARAGRVPVQVRFATELTSEQYVTQQGWTKASLDLCPLHPAGGCGVQRHGTYARVEPPGTEIARWYCRRGHTTISLLPDCLASHLSGSLAEVEAAVEAVEQAASVEAAAETLREDVELPGAVRWTRRRVQWVRALLTTLIGLMPEMFATCAPTLASFRTAMGTPDVLVTLRAVAAEQLAHLPVPVGLDRRARRRERRRDPVQQRMGPDPPPDRSDRRR